MHKAITLYHLLCFFFLVIIVNLNVDLLKLMRLNKEGLGVEGRGCPVLHMLTEQVGCLDGVYLLLSGGTNRDRVVCTPHTQTICQYRGLSHWHFTCLCLSALQLPPSPPARPHRELHSGRWVRGRQYADAALNTWCADGVCVLDVPGWCQVLYTTKTLPLGLQKSLSFIKRWLAPGLLLFIGGIELLVSWASSGAQLKMFVQA